MTEVWRLSTHPVLMGGASLLVTLRGVALDQDKSAQQRAALQVCVCRYFRGVTAHHVFPPDPEVENEVQEGWAKALNAQI